MNKSPNERYEEFKFSVHNHCTYAHEAESMLEIFKLAKKLDLTYDDYIRAIDEVIIDIINRDHKFL